VDEARLRGLLRTPMMDSDSRMEEAEIDEAIERKIAYLIMPEGKE